MSSELTATMAARKALIAELYFDLKRSGFGFEFPNEAFSEPDEKTEEYLTFFAEHGCTVPATVAEFYRQVGNVNFIGWSSSWDDAEYPDALDIMPLEAAFDEFKERYVDSAEEKKFCIETYGGFYFPLSPDYYHKQNISGGEAYGFVLPSKESDPPVLNMPWKLRFTEYIDFAISRRGFPGLGHLREPHDTDSR
jgi:hypothetical protein